MSLSKSTQNKIVSLLDIVVDKYLNKAKEKPKANSGNPFVMALLKDFEPLLHRIHGWDDAGWTCEENGDWVPERFNTRKEAQKALDVFLEEATEYDSEEFKIEEITM